MLAQQPDKPLTLTVRRGGKPPKDDAFGPLAGGEMIDVDVAAAAACARWAW